MITMSVLGKRVVPPDPLYESLSGDYMQADKVQRAMKDKRRTYDSITIAEWICWEWINFTTYGDKESMYLRGQQRPMDEAMKLAGGSIEHLRPYLWALKADA